MYIFLAIGNYEVYNFAFFNKFLDKFAKNYNESWRLLGYTGQSKFDPEKSRAPHIQWQKTLYRTNMKISFDSR